MTVFLPTANRRTDSSFVSVEQKCETLRSILRQMESVVIGFSGGADSALLTVVAEQELGPRAIAAIAVSESFPRREQEDAIAFAKALGINLITFETGELSDESYSSNPVNRCYYCKKELFVHLSKAAAEHDIRWIAYGANHDDLSDYRPGAVAAEEFGVRAPLIEAGLTKPEIRHISRKLGLPTWDKPAMACLSSRFPHGTRITAELLSMVERAEEFLRYDLGFRQIRVRHHDTVARIEVGSDELNRMLDPALRAKISDRLKSFGYKFVAVELTGYQSGSLNPDL